MLIYIYTNIKNLTFKFYYHILNIVLNSLNLNLELLFATNRSGLQENELHIQRLATKMLIIFGNLCFSPLI